MTAESAARGPRRACKHAVLSSTRRLGLLQVEVYAEHYVWEVLALRGFLVREIYESDSASQKYFYKLSGDI
jgi:hypothetical protein